MKYVFHNFHFLQLSWHPSPASLDHLPWNSLAKPQNLTASEAIRCGFYWNKCLWWIFIVIFIIIFVIDIYIIIISIIAIEISIVIVIVIDIVIIITFSCCYILFVDVFLWFCVSIFNVLFFSTFCGLIKAFPIKETQSLKIVVGKWFQ